VLYDDAILLGVNVGFTWDSAVSSRVRPCVL